MGMRWGDDEPDKSKRRGGKGAEAAAAVVEQAKPTMAEEVKQMVSGGGGIGTASGIMGVCWCGGAVLHLAWVGVHLPWV